MIESILFYILAAATIIAALAAITRVNAVMSAVWLVVCLMAAAGIFALLNAPFLAVFQVLIAAGAVMVLFLFVLMLVDEGPEGARARVINFGKVLGALSAAYLGIVLLIAALKSPSQMKPVSGEAFESPLTLGQILFSKYALPFELAGVLLLVAAVAAVVLAKKERSTKHDT